MAKRTSRDDGVEKFLCELHKDDEKKYDIILAARKIIFHVFPKVTERIIYGGIMFTQDDEDFGGLFASTHHVSFEFSGGHQMKDPEGLLEGSGKYRRHLKLRELSDVETKRVAFFVKQIKSLK